MSEDIFTEIWMITLYASMAYFILLLFCAIIVFIFDKPELSSKLEGMLIGAGAITMYSFFLPGTLPFTIVIGTIYLLRFLVRKIRSKKNDRTIYR